MYKNVGKQIKDLASIAALIEAIASVVTGVILACIDIDDFWWIGLIIIVGGLLVAWLSNLILYAYGELVDKTSLIESYLHTSKTTMFSSNHNKTAGDNEWKCSKCGSINQNYVGTCGCGQTKANN